LQEINAEFGLGTNLYAYRGVKWYRDDGSRGYFDQSMGNNPPIDMLEFYGKRKTIPVVASDRYYTNGEYFTVPFFNQIIFTLVGGQAGGQGGTGYYRATDGYVFETYAGNNGDPGGTSRFGNYASGPGGSPNLGLASPVVYTMNAETNQNFLQVGVTALITVGAPGNGGQGAPNYQDKSQYECWAEWDGSKWVTKCGNKFYAKQFTGYSGNGANGTTSGSVRIQVL
jgi:hypothetical protein